MNKETDIELKEFYKEKEKTIKALRNGKREDKEECIRVIVASCAMAVIEELASEEPQDDF